MNIRSMGYNPTDFELKLMIEDADIDKSGSIEFTEFVLMMALKIKDVPSDEELRDVFRGSLKNMKRSKSIKTKLSF